jgi:hypothetical protein
MQIVMLKGSVHELLAVGAVQEILMGYVGIIMLIV